MPDLDPYGRVERPSFSVTASHRTRHTARRIALLALAYAGAARLGLSLGAVSGFATLVWPPTGLALAALLLSGPELWPGVLLGAWAVNLWTGAPLTVAFGIAVGNTLEAVVGAYAMRRLEGDPDSFDSLRHVRGLVVGAAALSTLVSATVGVASLGLGGIVHSFHQAALTWRAWWVGDVLGDLVVAPLLLTWARRGNAAGLGGRRAAEALALGALVSAASCAVFFRGAVPRYPFESPYLLFPLLTWAALRFELRGATLATAVTSAIAVWGTTVGHGPFVRMDLASGLLALQTFMGCAALTALIVAGVTMDRARAIRAQETFVAAASHDLKNPLNALLLSAESLRRKVPDEAVQKHYEVAKRSTDRMMRLITDLLAASVIERGQLALEQKPEDVRALVNEALDVLRPLAAAKSLRLHVQPGEPAQAMCDRERVLQVLSNVLGNAIKFAPERSAIAIVVERDPRVVRVSVRDEGPGIEARELRHIFDRYWHARSSAGGGSGLGLFIARGIIDAHGGRIWAKSASGAGSTFYFTLPAAED